MYEDAVDMPESKLLEDGTVFPLTLSPSTVPSSAEKWVAENRERIVNGLLPRHGAVVIRGLDLPDAEAFSRVVKALDFEEQVRWAPTFRAGGAFWGGEGVVLAARGPFL